MRRSRPREEIAAKVIEDFEYFDTISKEFIEAIISSNAVEYFPCGNDPYMDSLVQAFRLVVNEKLSKVG